MTARRCPSCGGLIGADAEWCTQCFTRLDRAKEERAGTQGVAGGPPGAPGMTVPGAPTAPGARTERPPAGDGHRAGVRVTDRGVVWDCPVCTTENPIEVASCTACGTPFGRVFEESGPPPSVAPGRALGYSLLFPGLGHVLAGRGAEGVARAMVFAYLAATVVVILLIGGSPGPFLALLVVSIVAGVALYALSAADAARVARGEAQILTTRLLLYGITALILLTLAVLVIVGVRAGDVRA